MVPTVMAMPVVRYLKEAWILRLTWDWFVPHLRCHYQRASWYSFFWFSWLVNLSWKMFFSIRTNSNRFAALNFRTVLNNHYITTAAV